MQITTQEVEKTLNKYEDIDEPIVVKRDNKTDVVILSMKEYKERLQELEIIKNGRTTPASEFFKELRAEYGY